MGSTINKLKIQRRVKIYHPVYGHGVIIDDMEKDCKIGEVLVRFEEKCISKLCNGIFARSVWGDTDIFKEDELEYN